MATDFTHHRIALDLSEGIRGALDAIRDLAGQPNTIAIHGCLLPGRDPKGVVKRRGPKVTSRGNPWFSNANHLYQMFDMDNCTEWPLGRPARTQDEMAEAARHNWHRFGPDGLKAADVIVQLSNSVGFQDKFKAHYWVATTRLTCNESWRQHVTRASEGQDARPLDPAVHKAVQPLYTANPVVLGIDPLEKLGVARVFLLEGLARWGSPPDDVTDIDGLEEEPQEQQRPLNGRGGRHPDIEPDEVRKAIQERLNDLCNDIRNAQQGGRHETVNAAGYTLGGWLSEPGAPAESTVASALIGAAVAAGMSESRAKDEVMRALNDGSRCALGVENLVMAWRAAQRKQRPRESSQSAPKQERAAAAPPQADAGDWQRRLVETQKGGLRNCQANVNTILCNDPAWLKCLSFDEFSNLMRTMKRPPWGPDDGDAGWSPGKEWDDQDESRLSSWMMREYHFEPALQKSYFGARQAALANTRHPVREYLEGLTWDGAPRVERWLVEYCSAAAIEHTLLVGRWWLISGVARIFEPGVQVDHVLVLEGHKQGEGKSSAFRALMPNLEWFHGSKLDIGDKDGMQALQGVWLLELAELDGITSKRAAEELKEFLTRTDDRFRPPYGRKFARWLRQCFFGASVNGAEYLRDPTGNRRWWPVKTPLIDVARLRSDRDQLWAEAVHLYRSGAHWWPETDAHRQLLADHVATRSVADPWEEVISSWLERGSETRPLTAALLLSEALKVEVPARMSGADSNRIGRVMRSLGYERKQRRIQSRRCHVYVKIKQGV
jgi:predicted P-loop ATPase